MTFSPSINDDGTYNVDAGSVSVGHTGGTYETPYVENEETGERQYLISNQDLQQDGDYQPDNEAEYVSALTEAYPDLMDALAYARDNKTLDYINSFNQKIDTGDYGEYVPMIEELIAEFRSVTGTAPVEEELTDEPVVSPEEIDAAIEPMLETEALGMETAYEWLSMAEQTRDSNPTYSAVCAATAAFHDGSMTAEQAISSVLENYPINEVVKIYQYLNN